MESDQDQGDDQGANQVTPSRSYECNFCKRGFSNAQALGGHMNIHRKDKAKLKQQSSNQTQPSLDIHQKVPPLGGKSVEEPSKLHMRQLPLFAESPTSTETQKPQGQTHGEITSSTQGAPLSGQGSSSELDLELRLGPEPQDSSTPTGTRKFF